MVVNIGFIKSVSPIFNFDKVEENIARTKLHENKDIFHNDGKNENETDKEMEYNLYQGLRYQSPQQGSTKFGIKKGLKIKLDCEFCEGPTTGNPRVFRFANYEQFFCCKGCLSGYKQKYAGRIESIKRKFDERE
jgi:Lrp/AsnC family leucine-responsive transcriptional regulator